MMSWINYVNHLSLRKRFLFSPLLSLILFAALAAAFVLESQQQNVLLNRVAKKDMAAFDHYFEIFSEVSKQHMALYSLLSRAAKLDEETLYDESKLRLTAIRNAVHRLEQVSEELAVHQTLASSRIQSLHQQLQRHTQAYQQSAAQAIEISTVNLKLATERLNLANDAFVMMNQSFSEVLDAQRGAIDAEITGQVSRSQFSVRVIVLSMCLAALLMIGLSMLLARLLSRSIETQINLLSDLGKQAGGAEFATSGQHEVSKLGAVIASFQTILLRLKNSEHTLSLANQELRNEVVLRKQVEDDLRLSEQVVRKTSEEKMAALGTLVAGVAHEINTPMGIGVTAASNLQDEVAHVRHLYNENAMRKEDLEDFLSASDQTTRILLNNLERAAALIHRFKQVAVDQSSEAMRNIHLQTYLRDMMKNLEPKIKQTQLQYTIECPDEITLDSYPGALSQIVTNLVMNAIMHAYEPGQSGLLTIRAGIVEEQVKLEFSDNGVGIPHSIIDQIFNPFFTTKRGAGGSGLGLHIVYNLMVQTLNGSIHCNSKSGEGTTFTLLWPLVKPRSELSSELSSGISSEACST